MIIATAMRRLRRLWAVASALFLAGAYAPPLLAAVLFVNSTLDAPDANRFDGVCETAPGNGVCTLRAATQEAGFGVTIVLPAGTYQLSGGTLIVPGVTILGAGEDVTIIDGGALDTVINNSSPATLVGLTIRNGRAKSGSPNQGRSGGGIANQGNLKLQNVTVRDNVADLGAGISNSGTLTIEESTISGNTADSGFGRGGGIWNVGTLTIRNSTISGNAAVHIDSGSGADFGTGGGIENDGTFDLTNVTISANGGGGIYSVSTGTSYMASVTIAFHSNAPALTIVKVLGANGADMSGTHNINHALLSNNTPSNCSQAVAQGRIVSQGYNLDSDGTCGLAADGTSLIGQVPLLSPLAFYGGPTKTHDLAGAGVDAGDPAGCFDHAGPILRDQRGGNRTVRGRCDIGAVEQAAGVASAGRDQRVNPGQTVTLDGRNSFGDPLIAFYEWTQTAGTPVTLSNADKAVATFTAPQVPGSMDFRLSLKEGQAPDASSDSVTVTVNAPPVANAGADQSNLVYPVPVSIPITLDGGRSTDPDGGIASFVWTQTGGTSVVLTDAGRGRVTFVAPQVVGTWTFLLTVTDNEGLSSTDSVSLTMNPYPPIPGSDTGQGCTIGRRDSPSDPSLPALVALATLVLWRRRKRS